MSDWSDIAIVDAADTYAGGTPSRDNPSYFGGSIPWVKSTEVNLGRIRCTGETLTSAGFRHSAAKWIPANSVVVALYGATAAQVAFLEIEATANQAVLAVVPKEANAEYVYYALSFAKPQILYRAQGSGQPNLNKGIIDRTVIRSPDSIVEQAKIAEILSTVDRAIEQTEALIAKQQRIKTGLMQDLLTRGIDEHGNLRSEETHEFKDSPLGRIPVEWTPSTIGDVGLWASGGTPSKTNPQFWGGSVPWVSPKDMKSFDLEDTIDKITDAGARYGSRLMPAGTIFIVIRGMILAHTFPVCFATRPMAFNQDVKAISVRNGVSSRFLAYWLAANEQTMLKIATTATHGTKRFDMDDLYAVDITLPPETEQELIAKSLDDVQEQVLLTRSHMRKLNSLKTALMQDLLTGEIRVIPLLDNDAQN